MYVNYLIVDRIRIKDIVYCINNQKIMYFVNYHNHRNLTKIMNNMRQQMRKIYSYADIKEHMKRVQIIDRYDGNNKKSTDYKDIHASITDYMQTLKEQF